MLSRLHDDLNDLSNMHGVERVDAFNGCYMGAANFSAAHPDDQPPASPAAPSTPSPPPPRARRHHRARSGCSRELTVGLHEYFLFAHKNSRFAHKQFSTVFYSTKMTESEKIVLVSLIFDFDDRQV